MRRTVIAAIVALALTAIVMPRIIGTVAPSAEAQSPPPSAPGVPVTAGTVATGLVTATIGEPRGGKGKLGSCRCDSILPLRRRFGSEGPQR
jgi:hypothetical protein